MGAINAKTLLLAAAGVTAIAAIAVLVQGTTSQAALDGLTLFGQPVTGEQVARGREVYGQSCASCHGKNLEGQPDWMRRLDTGRMPAPPHDEAGHTWHHSDQDLLAITKFGIGAVVPGYESDMPAFDVVLGDDEIAAVLAFIKSTWPERQRDYQGNVMANDEDR